MTLSPMLRQNISLAWPLLVNAILHQSIVLIDTLLVSSLGSTQVAALGVATTILFYGLGVQFAFASGTQLILARCLGANDQQQVSKNFTAGLAINTSLSIGMAVLLLIAPISFHFFITDSEPVASYVASYLKISAITLLFSGASQVAVARLNAAQKTKVPLIGLGIEIPVNVLISLVLIHGLPGSFEGFGLVGAAWGSLVAMMVRAIYLFVRSWQLFPRVLSQIVAFNRGIVKGHFFEASPIAVNYLTLTTGIMLYQLLFARLPVEQYAAIVLLLPWIRIGGQVGTTWGQATSIQISRLLGEKKPEAIQAFMKESVWFTVAISGIVSVGFLVFVLLSPTLYGHIDVPVLAAILLVSPWFIALPLVRVLNTVVGQSLRALFKSKFVLKVHVITQWFIALPLCALLIWFNASVFWVFSILVFEELLKTFPFMKKLSSTTQSLPF